MNKKETYFAFIEMLAIWEGYVNSADLVSQFSLSQIHAKRTLTEYKEVYPGNLEYSDSERKFTISDNFCAHTPINYDYFTWLTTKQLIEESKPASLNIAVINADKRYISPTIMRLITQAIRKRQRLEIDYVSLSTPVSEGRVIQPHSLVKTAQRWHVRAYDESRSAFRDFVISRFRGLPETCGPATHTVNDDEAWISEETLIFVPDSRLSHEQKKIVEEDYGMQDGKLSVTCKAALIQYLLDEMQIKTKFHDANPAAQQLVLSNFDTVKQWLFDS